MVSIGPFLVKRERSKWPRLHRWFGRLYLLGDLVGGLAHTGPVALRIIGDRGLFLLVIFDLASH
jgi:hypothetical protein